jgi:hypothetical protein
VKLKQTISLVTLIACAATLYQTAAAQEDRGDKTWQFDVLLDGKPIGYHTFNLADGGGNRVLESKASFDVKFLFINAFSYRHQATEVWNDNCLLSIDATTDANGKLQTVRGQTAEQRFQLQQPEDNDLPACVKSFAYWNPAVLDAERLLNSQTGQYEDVTVTFEREETVTVADESVDAKRYRLTTRGGDIMLWYSSDTQTWVGLEAPAKGGRTLTYRPTGVPLSTARSELLAQGG